MVRIFLVALLAVSMTAPLFAASGSDRSRATVRVHVPKSAGPSSIRETTTLTRVVRSFIVRRSSTDSFRNGPPSLGEPSRSSRWPSRP